MKSKVHYLVGFLLIASSGFPYFTHFKEWIFINGGIVFVLFWLLKSKLVFSRNFYIVILLQIVINILQSVSSLHFPLLTFLGIYYRYFFAYISVLILGRYFFKVYINIIYFFTIISLLIYIPSVLFPGIVDPIINNVSKLIYQPFSHSLFSELEARDIIIFNFNQIELNRNSGPFWEPTAFGSFLLIAIFFNTIELGKLYTKKNFIFFAAILSTMSTTTYLALFLFIFYYHSIISTSKKTGRFALLTFLGVVMAFAFYNVTFLNEKINYKLYRTEANIRDFSNRSRFASALLDLNEFIGSPIWGVGKTTTLRYGEDSASNNVYFNNGTTNLLVINGGIFFLLFFYYYYSTVSRLVSYKKRGMSQKWSVLFVAVLLILGFSEGLFKYVLFYSFLFAFSQYNYNGKTPIFNEKIKSTSIT